MKFERVEYKDLNSKQKEIYNFQKLAGVLADFGYNCIKLADDRDADFLAYHQQKKDTYRIQMKSRLTVDKKYLGKNLHIAFPISSHWYLVEHDFLVELITKATNWTNTDSWILKGIYHSASPSKKLLLELQNMILN